MPAVLESIRCFLVERFHYRFYIYMKSTPQIDFSWFIIRYK